MSVSDNRARRWSRWALVPIVLILAASCGPCGTARETSRPQRLIDQLPEPQQRESAALIDGVVQPTLPRLSGEQRFVLAALPANPVLMFSVGIVPGVDPLNARFEVLLQRASGPVVPLYNSDVSVPGWRDERIELSGYDLTGAALLFRRTALANPPALQRAVWGNPMLVAGAPSRRPSVILISLDTLRADFVGAYGRISARTGALDRLAREGALYEQAYSSSTWTLPSHASMLFGLTIPVGSDPIATPQLAAHWSGPERPLASILRDAGYHTAGFTGGGYVDWQFGFARGFDTYYSFQTTIDGLGCGPKRFDGESVFSRSLRWLRSHREQPFFLFIHTYDVHDRCGFIPLGTELLGVWPTLSPARQQELLEYYDRLIGEADRRVATLLAVLDELKLSDSTVIILTSDHGEGFDEHGIRGHGCDLKPYEELSRVPLIVRHPPQVPASARIDAPVSLVDVAPTALALLGLPVPQWMSGAPLPGLGLRGSVADDRPLFIQCGDALAVRSGPDKLITSRTGRYPDERYVLTHDKGERQPVGSDGARQARLRQAAAAFWRGAVAAERTPGADVRVDDGTKERLRALGYDK